MKLFDFGVYLLDGKTLVPRHQAGPTLNQSQAKKGAISYRILQAHNTSGNPENLKIRFDAITSQDLTYVGIIQTARASGLDRFPLPYVLTCCHNSLCAVGGTINRGRSCLWPDRLQKIRRHLCPPIWVSSTNICARPWPAAER